MNPLQGRDGALRAARDDGVLEARLSIALKGMLPVLSVAGSIEALLGFTADDYLSARVSLKQQIHPHDSDIADMLFSSGDPGTLGKPRTSGTFNIRLRHANGRIRCISGQYSKESGAEGPVLNLLLQDAKTLQRTMPDASAMVNFTAMMENTDDYIYFKDRHHVFTGASQTLVSLCDPSEHWTDLLGQTDYDVFPEEYADIYYRLEKQIFSGMPVAREIQETLTKDGIKGWIDNRKYPIRDEHGEIIGLYGIARDITERKQAELALRESEERWKFAIEGAGDGLWDWNIQTDAAYYSPRYKEMFGYVEADFGTTSDEWSKRIHPDDAPGVFAALRPYMEGKPGSAAVEFRMLCKDGSWKWTLGRGMVVSRDADGKALRMIGTNADITERKVAEAALLETKAMLSRTEEIGKLGGWEFDIDTMQQTWTKAVYAIHEVDFTDHPTVEQGISFYTPESRPIIELAVKRAIEHGEPFDLDLEIITAKGNLRAVHAMGRHDPACGKIVGFFQDISARKQSELLITQSEQRLELAVGGAGLGLWDWHVATGELTVNDRWRSMLGLDPAGPMPTIDLWNSLVHVDDLPTLDQLFKDVIMNPTGRNFEIEIRARHRDGHYLWIFDKGHVAERAADGSPLRVVGIHLDISERKHAALLLAESESQRLAAISATLEVQAQSSRTALSLMEDAVAARQQAESLSVTLTEQLDELRRWQQATLNRESRILSVKKEINALLAAQGQPPRYPSAANKGVEE